MGETRNCNISILDKFDSKIENLKLGIIDENNFKLVKEYLSGEKDYTFDIDENDQNFFNYFFAVDGKNINTNINEIKAEMRKLKNNNAINDEDYQELKEKIYKIKANAYDYDSFIKAANNSGLDKIRKLAKEYEVKVIYGIIELRASLGLNTDYMLGRRVYEYCSTIAKDVNSGKYKKLTFTSKHIDEDGNII